MCNNIVRNKLSDKLSTLAAMVESNLSAGHDLVYFVREYSWDNQACWMDGLIDGDPCVSFIFGENLEGDNGVYLTISHEGGENQTSRIRKLDKSLEEQTDEVIRAIASDICQMVEEYYILSVLADMLKCSLRAKYRRAHVEILKHPDGYYWINCDIGGSMYVPICEISGIRPYVRWWIMFKTDVLLTESYELSESLDEQDESTIRAIADCICQSVSEYYTEDNK